MILLTARNVNGRVSSRYESPACDTLAGGKSEAAGVASATIAKAEHTDRYNNTLI